MGIKQLSKKYKATKQGKKDAFLIHKFDEKYPTRTTVEINDKINGKHLGFDLAVSLHKGIGNVESAGKFYVEPPIPISKVEDICMKTIAHAKRCSVTIVVCA